MLQRFVDFASRHNLFVDGGHVLLAVSGGRDSVCMAHLAHQAHLPFAIAHCNFHLRPADCDRDQAFVGQLARQFDVPFFTTDFDTTAYAHTHGYSIEQAARLLRYSYFAHLCQSEHFSSVATAHHLDDSVETFFLNLFRGTGIAGLHGILPISHLNVPYSSPHATEEECLPLTVIHPMLGFSRADIDHYLTHHHLSYVDDTTNAEPAVQRNRIRLQLMPLLRQLYPSVDTTMQANIERLRDVEQVYQSHILHLRQHLCQRLEPRLPWLTLPIDAFPIAELSRLSPRRTLLFELLRPYGFNASVVADIEDALASPQTGTCFRSDSHEALIDRAQLLVAPFLQPLPPRLITTETVFPSPLPSNNASIYVSPHALRQPLRLRLWQPADRFCPFGMSDSRLVSDFLKDIKLNAIEKRHLYLLVDADDRVVWVVGLRADNRFRVDGEGQPCLQITASR